MVVNTKCSAPGRNLSHLLPDRCMVTEADMSYAVSLSSLNKVAFYKKHFALRCTVPCQHQHSAAIKITGIPSAPENISLSLLLTTTQHLFREEQGPAKNNVTAWVKAPQNQKHLQVHPRALR